MVWVYSGKPRKPGAVSGLFAVGYGCPVLWWNSCACPTGPAGLPGLRLLTMGQALCLPLILVGLWLLFRKDDNPHGSART